MRAPICWLLLFVGAHAVAQKPVDVPSRAPAVPPQINASENTVVNYSGVVPTTFAGALDADDSTYNRVNGCGALSGVGTAVAYDTVTINNPTGAAANFAVTSTLPGGGACGDPNDTYFTLYSTTFNPASPLTNCLAISDDISGPSNRCSSLSFSIPAGATRVLAVAGFNNAASVNGLFAYSINFAGTATTCVSNPVVANANDVGAGSLRQAIADACPGSNITFAGGVVASNLTTAELLIDKNLTIDGGAGVTVARQAGSPNFRIFNITGAATTVTLDSLTISGGRIAGDGAGIINFGVLTILSSTISGNASIAGNGGGGIASIGTLNLADSTIAGNSATFFGGGLLQIDGGSAVVTRSTFVGNSAPFGGAIGTQSISRNASLQVINSTLSGNTATNDESALGNYASGAGTTSTVTMTHSTIVGNSGPIAAVGNNINAGTATMSLGHNLYADNANSNVTGPAISSLGNNLSDDATGGGSAGDLINTNPLLAPLGNYGGPTQTHALLPGSPAINGGVNAGAPATDQRGIARPQLVTVDIGAFESRGFALTVVSGTPQSTALNAAFAAPLVVGVTANVAGEPVNGGLIGYAAPGAGASAALAANPATIAGGQASVIATANGTPGSYNVTAATNGASGTPTFTLTNVRTIDLGMTLTDNPDSVIAGNQLTYLATLANAGPNDALDVSITLPLPAGSTYVSSTPSAGANCTTPAVGANGTVACTWPGATAVGTPRTVSVIALVGAAVANGTVLSATAAAAGTGTDPTAANNSATATTTVDASANLSITLTDAPDPVTAGTNLTLVATLTNGGPSDAQNVSITVPLPLFTSPVSLTASAGGICSGSICNWAGATAPGTPRTATLVVQVGAGVAQGTVLDSSATASSPTTDPNPGNNQATLQTTVNASADLSITLTDSDPVAAGTNLTYVATLTNGGPSGAQGATISLPLPTGTTFVSATPSAGNVCTTPAVGANGTVSCTWAGATIPTGTRSVSVIALVSPSQLANLSATATASSTTTDPTSGNNTATATTTVNTSADLSITLTDNPDPVIAGTNLTYVATLSKTGPSDAQGANITLPLPVGTSFILATASTGGVCVGTTTVVCTWAGATAPGVDRIATIVVLVSSGQTANLSATATAASTTSDPSTGNNTVTATTEVQVQADLSVTLADAPDPVIAGTQLTYTAVVSNAGPSDATGVVLALPTPTNTSFVSGTVTGGGACAGSPVVCTVGGSMLQNTSRTVSIVMLVAAAAPEGSSISATASVTAGSPDPNLANNSASATTAVITRADLLLNLSASVAQTLTNAPVTFTATSLNQGPSDAQGVSVTITLTPDFRYSGHTATGATCTTPQVGNTGAIVCTWAGATAPGVTRTLTVVAFSNVEGQTAVSASTTSNTTDPTPNNNLGNLTVQVGYQVEEIPTLSSLGLILMGLLFGLIGFVVVRRQG